jgi:hypothetical protein
MPKKNEFHSVEFFRKVRDKQAATLAGKSQEEIIAFFGSSRDPRLTKASSRPAGSVSASSL